MGIVGSDWDGRKQFYSSEEKPVSISSEDLAAQIAAFEKGGGKVQQIPKGKAAKVERATKSSRAITDRMRV